MDFTTLEKRNGNYITPLFEEKIENVVWSVDVSWEGTMQRVCSGVENAGESWEALQNAVDLGVAIIQADPNKERIDRIIARWLINTTALTLSGRCP